LRSTGALVLAATCVDDAEGAESVDRDHVGDRLRVVCTAAAGELGLDGVTITVMTPGVDAPAASSGPAARAWEDLQFALGEGPTREAFDSGHPVLAPRLDDARERWPGFASQAAAAGVRAVFAFPLQLGAIRFGGLTAYSGSERFLTRDEVGRLLVHADAVTELLLDGATVGTEGEVGAELLSGLDIRSEVFQAQGMVAVDLGVGLVEALARMRARAFREDLGLTELAVRILDGYRLADEPPEAPPGEPRADA